MRRLFRLARHIAFGAIGALIGMLIIGSAETLDYAMDQTGNKIMLNSPEFAAMIERHELPTRVAMVWKYGPLVFENNYFGVALPLALVILSVFISTRIGGKSRPSPDSRS